MKGGIRTNATDRARAVGALGRCVAVLAATIGASVAALLGAELALHALVDRPELVLARLVADGMVTVR